MLKNILAGTGVILGGGLSLFVAYVWGLDDGMNPEKNKSWFTEYCRKLNKIVLETD